MIIKFRQPIYSNGIFNEFHYWGIGLIEGGEKANVSFATFKQNVTDPEDSQQYTGVNDINEKEIYVGDIVILGKGYAYEYLVDFVDGAFVLIHTELKDYDGKPLMWGNISKALDSAYFKLEVIDNLYSKIEK